MKKPNFSIFTHNWGTKLTALILAVVVFYCVRNGCTNYKGPIPTSMKGYSDASAVR